MNHFYLRVTSADKLKTIISVSKKVSKSAVVRNTIRRRIRPMLPKLVSNLKPANYFIVARPGAEKIKGEALSSELAAIFKKS